MERRIFCQKQRIGKILKQKSDFYCLNCFHSFRTVNKQKLQENVSKNHDYCNVKMPEESDNISKI